MMQKAKQLLVQQKIGCVVVANWGQYAQQEQTKLPELTEDDHGMVDSKK